MEERHLRRVMVEVDQTVRRLADDDRAIGPDHLTRELQHRQALGHREVLEHGVQQEDVHLAAPSGHRVEDLIQRMELELDVVDAPPAKLLLVRARSSPRRCRRRSPSRRARRTRSSPRRCRTRIRAPSCRRAGPSARSTGSGTRRRGGVGAPSCWDPRRQRRRRRSDPGPERSGPAARALAGPRGRPQRSTCLRSVRAASGAASSSRDARFSASRQRSSSAVICASRSATRASADAAAESALPSRARASRAFSRRSAASACFMPSDQRLKSGAPLQLHAPVVDRRRSSAVVDVHAEDEMVRVLGLVAIARRSSATSVSRAPAGQISEPSARNWGSITRRRKPRERPDRLVVAEVGEVERILLAERLAVRHRQDHPQYRSRRWRAQQRQGPVEFGQVLQPLEADDHVEALRERLALQVLDGVGQLEARVRRSRATVACASSIVAASLSTPTTSLARAARISRPVAAAAAEVEHPHGPRTAAPRTRSAVDARTRASCPPARPPGVRRSTTSIWISFSRSSARISPSRRGRRAARSGPASDSSWTR